MHNDQLMVFELTNIKFDRTYAQIMNILKTAECIFWGFATCTTMSDDSHIEPDLYTSFE